MKINGISNNLNIQNIKPKVVGDDGFKNILNEFLGEANKTDRADKISNIDLMVGNAENTHDPMLAAEKADISLRLTVQIRNKILDSYNEIMRMQI